MRYLFGFLCVCALGLMPMVGCTDDAGTGGSGGTGGDGGTGGSVACEGNVCPCNEAGIRAAIEAGGTDPYTFDCEGPTTVVTRDEIIIDNDVILDGEGNLTVDGDEDHPVFFVPEDVTAELLGFNVARGLADGSDTDNGRGGGIGNQGALTLNQSTVSDNECVRSSGGGLCTGGGINNAGTLSLLYSTVSGNAADNRGGGIHNGGSLIVTNSTVSGNDEKDIYGSGVITVTNSTLSDIFITPSGALTLLNSTVSGKVTNFGGGPGSSPGSIIMVNSLVDGDCEGPITSNGYNIESPGDTCGFDQTGDLVNITEGQLNLGELADNGGPTMTHALGEGSVAIDVIPGEDCEVDEDQRGEPRPETGGTMCDVGSFEAQSAPAEGCIQSGGTVSTALCCQAVESFPNTCTIGACGCAPDASHEVAFCICPTNTCFDGESCVAQ
jgi:hypothetical protein